jgi:hypothetical protein
MPSIQKDPLYDEPVNIDMEPEEALQIVLQVSTMENEKDEEKT